MKLAFSSNAYMNFSIEEAIQRVAACGYAGIEILAEVPHAWPVNLLPERRDSIRRTLRECKLAVSNVNGFMMNAVNDPRQPYWHPSWIEPDPHYRAIRREHTRRAMALAKELGASNLQTEPGGPLAPGQSWDDAASVFYEELMPCVADAERLGVSLLIEPEPGLLIERFDEFCRFMERIDSPAVGLNFDIGHAYCVAEDPQDFVHKMAPFTRHYHLEDIAASRVHKHLIPGTGAIDFGATLRAIAKTGYDGWITVELYPYIENPDQAATEAFDFVTCLAGRLGVDLTVGERT